MTTLSRGAELLDALLELGGPEAEAVYAAAHRTQINAYRRGPRRPSVATAAAIEAASNGKIPATSWGQRGERKLSARPPAKRRPKPTDATPPEASEPKEGAA